MSTTDAPIAVYAQTSQAGRPYIELQVTGQAAIDLARAITHRLQANLAARSGIEALTTLIAGAITDHPVTLTTEQADDLAEQLFGADGIAWETSTQVGDVA